MSEAPTEIEITLNGKPAWVTNGSTVVDLLREKHLVDRLVVVEHNGVIVPRSDFAETHFTLGDVVEIVHFVGGGSVIDG